MFVFLVLSWFMLLWFCIVLFVKSVPNYTNEKNAHTFSGWQHDLLVGVHVTKAVGVEGFQLAF